MWNFSSIHIFKSDLKLKRLQSSFIGLYTKLVAKLDLTNIKVLIKLRFNFNAI